MDLKDENVVIDENYTVKLIDFGSACVFTNPATELLEFHGTLTYAPPEVLRGEKYRCDKAESWSLGVLLYTMLQGHLPFKNVQDAVYSKHIPLTKPVSPECADLLDQLLSNNSIARLTLKETIKHHFLFS
jgi:serine/threonine protein kinase